MKHSEALFGLLRIPLDALAVSAALLLGYRLRLASVVLIPGVQLLEPPLTLPELPVYLSTFVYPGVGAFVVVAALLGMYVLASTRSAWNEVGRILMATLLWIVIVMGWYFLVRKELFYSRILLVHSGLFIILFVSMARASVVLLQRAFLHLGVGIRSVVSLGSQPLVQSVQRNLEDDIRYHYLGHLRDLQALKDIEKSAHIDLVLQTDPQPGGSLTAELIDHCRNNHIGYAFLPPVLADVPHLLRIERLGLVPTVHFQPTPLDGWGRIIKRLFDLVVSAILLVVLAPGMLVIALLILLTEGLPVLYLSRRVGEHGQVTIPFLKFRSMVRDADARKESLKDKSHRRDGPLFKIHNDPRVTDIGRVLRRWDLDELPQLVNVLLGHMSLVGPRPHLPEEVDRYNAYQRRVFAVKPGITGLPQVSGRSDLKFEEEVNLDLRYVEEWSIFLDLWILWRTVGVVLSRKKVD